jgi:hypothetical protein
VLGTVLVLTVVSCQHPPAPAKESEETTGDLAQPAAGAGTSKRPDAAALAAAEPAGLGFLRQPAPMHSAGKEAALYEIGAFPLRNTQLRPGPEDDVQLVQIYCVGCHSTAYIAMQPRLSHAAWEAEVKKMRGTFGAVIPDPVATRIVTYLSAYYGSNP